MSERLSFTYKVQFYTRDGGDCQTTTCRSTMHIVGFKDFWRRATALRPDAERLYYKVMAVASPPAPLFTAKDRSKAHYKLLRHSYKKAKKAVRVEKYWRKIQAALYEKYVSEYIEDCKFVEEMRVRQEMEDTELYGERYIF